MFLLRAVLNILVRNASPRGPMCFRCLIFNLSGPCELLFLLCFIVVHRHAQKTVNRAPIAGGGEVRHNLHSSLKPLWQLHRL